MENSVSTKNKETSADISAGGKTVSIELPMQERKEIKLVRRSYLESIFEISRATIYRMMADDEFPHPVYLPGGGARWVWDEVMEWAEKRIGARG